MSIKHTLLLTLLVLACSGILATELENCAMETVNTAFFNMCPYARRGPINLNSSQSPVNPDLNITFSLGTPTVPSCEDPSVQIWGTVQDNSAEPTCYDIAIDAPVLSFINSDDSDSGLISAFPINTGGSHPYFRTLSIMITCNTSGSINETTYFSVRNITDAAIIVTANSYYGCPYATLNKILDFLEQYKYPFVAIAVVLGLFLLLFGIKMFKYAVFIVTLVAGTLFSAMCFFEFTKFGTQNWILWVIFGACLIIGIVLGYLAVRYERFGFFILGAALGVIGGLFLYSAVLSHFMQGENVLFYVIMVVLGLIGGGLGIWLWKDITIVSTSLIGSYLAVRAVSVLIGGFPNELAVAKGVTNLNAFAYIYLAVIVILALGGIYYQYKEKRRLEDEEEAETVSAFYRKN